jgi:hypothetical protein
MNLADQFTTDATAGGTAQQPQMTLAQQFAADAAAGSQAQATQAKAQATQTASDNGLAQDLAAGGMSPDALNQMRQIAGGAAHGVGSMFNNAANFVEKGVAAGLNAIPGIRDTGLARAAQQTANADVLAQAQTDQAFKQNAAPGAQAASIVAPMLVPMGGVMKGAGAIRSGVQALPMMGGTAGRLVGSALGNAATGAALSTGAPIDPNGPDYWSQVGKNALVGGGLGVAIPAAIGTGRAIGSNIWNAVRPIVNPRAYVGQGFANAIGDQAGDVANSIRGAQQFVPDSLPTTAQAGTTPLLVATEKAAANNDPAFKIALANRENANNAARWNSLFGVAGTDLDLQNAIAARNTATNPLYNIAKQQSIPVDQPMSGLMARPAMQSAIKRAQTLADNNEAGPIFQTARIPNSMGGSPTTSQTLTGNGAQAVKEALDAMLLPENTQKLSGKEIGALQDTRSAYISWLEGHSPAFTQARQTYAAMSPPINTMQAGQQMVDRLGGLGRTLNSTGATSLTAPGYSTALNQALKAQEFGIDPAAQTTLENIGRDLQRSTISNSLKSPGSDTAYNLAANGWLARNLYGSDFGGATGLGRALGAAGALATGHPMIGLGILGGGAKLGQMVGGRLNGQLSNFLLNPNELLPYLDARAATAVNAAQQVLPGLMQRQLLPAVIGGVTRGGLMNAQ